MVTTVEPEITVQGTIRVSSIHQIKDYPDVKIWNIDCHSKYYEAIAIPGVRGIANGESQYYYHVALREHDDTLYKDEDADGWTEIRFPLEGNGWNFTAESGKYDTLVIAWRYDED